MDLANYLKFVLALLFVLGLIGLLATAVRRWGLGLPQMKINKSQEKRLKLVEIMSLDAKRRLVLLSRDGIEHLVILGPNGETVVEHNIPAQPQDFAKTLEKSIDQASAEDKA